LATDTLKLLPPHTFLKHSHPVQKLHTVPFITIHVCI
jgi:hypothetical protein